MATPFSPHLLKIKNIKVWKAVCPRFFSGVERLKFTFQYIGCKQSLGGVVSVLFHVICKCGDKGDDAIKKGFTLSITDNNSSWIRGREENDHRNYFMINLHEKYGTWSESNS